MRRTTGRAGSHAGRADERSVASAPERRVMAAVAVVTLIGSAVTAYRAGPATAAAAVPNRVLDTRSGVGAPARRLNPGEVLALPVTAAVAAHGGSASLNLTATDAVAAGFVTAWPCGQPMPSTSILNVVPGRVSANHAVVGIGSDGVCVSASQPVNLVADLMGWFGDAADYQGTTPTRLLDTRLGHIPLAAGTERRVPVSAGAGYRVGLGAVALNLTVVAPVADGFLVAYPCGARPLASTVNFRAGETVANFTIVSFTGGEVCLFTNVATDVAVDSFGWSANSARLRSATPARVLDTRDGTGWSAGAARPSTPLTLRVAGRGGVPNDAAAALLTLTATGGTAEGFVTAWPCDQPRPLASVLNLRPGYLGSNLAYLPLSSADGTACLLASTSDASPVHLVADVVGWETGGPPRQPPPPEPVPSNQHFATLPPGSALPSEAACTKAVRAAPEVRADNAMPNHTTGVSANSLYPRVTGNFAGTTDEILQWVACKWGIDEDIVRAQVAKESWWHMSTVGDNGESFGLGQVRVPFHGTAFVNDNAKRSSAYNVDYTYAVWRSCFEGELTWLNTVERVGTYGPGDAWGCTGVWFSGRWHIASADQYIVAVQNYLARRIWTSPDFLAG